MCVYVCIYICVYTYIYCGHIGGLANKNGAAKQMAIEDRYVSKLWLDLTLICHPLVEGLLWRKPVNLGLNLKWRPQTLAEQT
jgi:hypothetical protein